MLALCSCKQAPQTSGPRPLGDSWSVFKGAGELRVEYEYEPLGPNDMVFHMQMMEIGGQEFKDVEVAIAVEGFDVLEGELGWTTTVVAGTTDRRSLRLRAQPQHTRADLRISTRHAAAEETINVTQMAFRIHEEEDIRRCHSEDAECK